MFASATAVRAAAVDVKGKRDPLTYLSSDDYRRIKESLVLKQDLPEFTYDECLRVKLDIYHQDVLRLIAKHERDLDMERYNAELGFHNDNTIWGLQLALANERKELEKVTNQIKSMWD